MIQKEKVTTDEPPCIQKQKPFISLAAVPLKGLSGVKALAAKPEGLSLIPGTQMLEDN